MPGEKRYNVLNKKSSGVTCWGSCLGPDTCCFDRYGRKNHYKHKQLQQQSPLQKHLITFRQLFVLFWLSVFHMIINLIFLTKLF